MNNGVDSSMNHGWISAVHGDEDLERTVKAYERALAAMVAEGAFKGA
jgi:glutamate-1-semialdehyde aminotransferase